MKKIKKQLASLQIKAAAFNELLGFLWARKLWWIIPLILLMLVAMTVISFGAATGVAPFVYPLF